MICVSCDALKETGLVLSFLSVTNRKIKKLRRKKNERNVWKIDKKEFFSFEESLLLLDTVICFDCDIFTLKL